MDRASLQVIPGAAVVVDPGAATDPAAFQVGCVDQYWASCVARGFSPSTIENNSGVPDRVLAMLGRPAWEATVEDVDRVVGRLAADGLAASTRRGYVQAFQGFHRFLQSRKTVEIDDRPPGDCGDTAASPSSDGGCTASATRTRSGCTGAAWTVSRRSTRNC